VLLRDSNTIQAISAARDEIRKLLDSADQHIEEIALRPPKRPSTPAPQLPDPMKLDTELDSTPANFSRVVAFCDFYNANPV